ncbi:MAG: NUDIX hydrolase [Actinobacteria bacterium]|nr:NUDIX hydrolase [Actinomycetota bacterium]
MKNRRLSSRRVYEGGIINLRIDEVELPDGRRAGREIVEHPGAAVIVPIDDNDNVYLVRQYRDAAGSELLELPAGKLKPGEDPLDCARREFLEELCLEAASWSYLASFYSSPGFCDEILHCYLAQRLSPGNAEADREEFLEPIVMPLEPVDTILHDVKDAKTFAGLLLARKYLAAQGSK